MTKASSLAPNQLRVTWAITSLSGNGAHDCCSLHTIKAVDMQNWHALVCSTEKSVNISESLSLFVPDDCVPSIL
jgi:hypothetical protein